jgi:Copper transport outer membrane protein, MctB
VISFRQLVVTIVSIFLALGLGILAGTTIIDQSLVKTLRDNTHAAEHARDRYKRLSDASSALITLLVPQVVGGRLAHRKVILVTDANTDGGALGEVKTFLTQAKADVVAELHTTSSLAPGSTARASLEQVLTTNGAPPPGEPSETAARALADRLATGAPPADAQTGKPSHDLLADLLSGGFLDFPTQSPPKPQDVGGPGQMVVIVAGGHDDPAVPFDSFMLPFAEQLVGRGVRIGAAEPKVTSQSLVGLLRADQNVEGSDAVVTVDDLSPDDPAGGIALVLGLRDLLRAHPQGGDYGMKPGNTDGLMPSRP